LKTLQNEYKEQIFRFNIGIGFIFQYAEEHQFDSNEELIRPQIKLRKVIDGVFNLATRLYEISLKKVNISVYHPEIEAYKVFDKNEQFLSILYTDFHPGDGKEIRCLDE
jgi:Zn-dependent oligopeptidase